MQRFWRETRKTTGVSLPSSRPLVTRWRCLSWSAWKCVKSHWGWTRGTSLISKAVRSLVCDVNLSVSSHLHSTKTKASPPVFGGQTSILHGWGLEGGLMMPLCGVTKQRNSVICCNFPAKTSVKTYFHERGRQLNLLGREQDFST